MSTHGGAKFDEPMCASLRIYAAMFTSVSDIMRWNDMAHAAPSYHSHYEKWKNALEESLDLIVKDSELTLSAEEEQSMDIALTIGSSIFERFLKKATAVGWASQTKEERQLAVEKILSLPQVPQRTQAWYAQGKSVLTASEFATLYGTERAVRQLAVQKIQPPQQQSTNRLACLTHEMGPFDWGIRFEPVVKIILEERWGAKILEAGRLLHPTDSLLAASPDGLLIDAEDPARVGRLLEIKCPITREINETIPFEYWCQMQIQMEVTGIDECEYVEVKLDSITPKKTDLSGAVPDGFVWLLQNPSTCEMVYAYTEAEKADYQNQSFELIETIPWRLSKLFTRTVARDRAWFQGTAPMRQQFWETVKKLRTGEIVPFEPRQKQKVIVAKEGVCLITDEPGATVLC
jgi:hypothetical protein